MRRFMTMPAAVLVAVALAACSNGPTEPPSTIPAVPRILAPSLPPTPSSEPVDLAPAPSPLVNSVEDCTEGSPQPFVVIYTGPRGDGDIAVTAMCLREARREARRVLGKRAIIIDVLDVG